MVNKEALKVGQKIAVLDMLDRPVKYLWIESVDDQGRISVSHKRVKPGARSRLAKSPQYKSQTT